MDKKASPPDSAGQKTTVLRLCQFLSDGWSGQGTALRKQVLCLKITGRFIL